MMSNPPSSLQQRQRLHRRQNSTPVAFEAMKVQHPATIQRQNSQHRRGQSIDSRSPIRRQHHHTGSMTIPYDNMTMNADMQAQSMPAHSHFVPQAFNMSTSTGLPVGFEIDENNQHYFQNAHMFPQHVGMSMHDRSMSQPDLRIYTGMRPLTPTDQIQTAHYPLTPAQTPFRAQHPNNRSFHASPVRNFQDDSIKSPHPVSMQKSRSLQGIVEQEEILTESSILPATFEIADMPNPASYAWGPEPVKQERSKTLNAGNAQSAPCTPDDETLPFFDENGGEKPDLNDIPVPDLSREDDLTGSLSPTRPALSPRRMSISDLNLEPGISASIEETNVTLDDIAQFIDGPHPSDNKWVCRFEGCGKRFGRKENIKSHVQTHLGDRQFRCNHCKKCFVRGHDLKRHAKIHTGTKPYPCLCGNAFARHDALTRHRQRGMCIGAFDGIVKKVIKRGRPRKHRPEMDERLDKAEKARRGQYDGLDQYTSSASSCSMSSWGSPPTESMDALSIREQSPYDDVNLFENDFPLQGMHAGGDSIALPPDMFTFTPPTSPGYSTGNRPSPRYRELSPAELTYTISANQVSSIEPPMPVLDVIHSGRRGLQSGNAMVLQHSQQSLPSLSHSSSSPAPELAAFDFGHDDATMGLVSAQSLGFGMSTLSATTHNGIVKLGLMSNQQERNDFDNFLDFSGVDMGLDGNTGDSFFAI